MGMNVGGGGGMVSDINVTPLVDVVLVLLIIFMVITPLSQMGYDVNIPRENVMATPPPPDQQNKQVILAINARECDVSSPVGPNGIRPDCTVRINKEAVRLADLPRRTTEIFKGRKAEDKVIFLAAEEKLNYEAVMQILDRAKAGVEDLQVGIVTDERLATSTGEAGAAAGAVAVPAL